MGVLSALIDNIPIMYVALQVNPTMDPGRWLLITHPLPASAQALVGRAGCRHDPEGVSQEMSNLLINVRHFT